MKINHYFLEFYLVWIFFGNSLCKKTEEIEIVFPMDNPLFPPSMIDLFNDLMQ